MSLVVHTTTWSPSGITAKWIQYFHVFLANSNMTHGKGIKNTLINILTFKWFCQIMVVHAWVHERAWVVVFVVNHNDKEISNLSTYQKNTFSSNLFLWFDLIFILHVGWFFFLLLFVGGWVLWLWVWWWQWSSNLTFLELLFVVVTKEKNKKYCVPMLQRTKQHYKKKKTTMMQYSCVVSN